MTSKPSQAPNKKSQLKDLLLLFSVPAAVVLVASAMIYAPRLLANPSYDFIYSYCDDYRCRDSYSIDANGNLEQRFQDTPGTRLNSTPAQLRYYDASADATRTIDYDTARAHVLSDSSKSPEGYELSRNSSGGGFLFWSDYDSDWHLEKGLMRKQVRLTTTNSYYDDDIKFIGWITK